MQRKDLTVLTKTEVEVLREDFEDFVPKTEVDEILDGYEKIIKMLKAKVAVAEADSERIAIENNKLNCKILILEGKI